jgi:hypothetical protein
VLDLIAATALKSGVLAKSGSAVAVKATTIWKVHFVLSGQPELSG